MFVAVKTSYNSPDAPVIGLLVRRPNGTWDPFREVDRIGTRPIVEIDEQTQMVRILYTRSNLPGDILEKQTPFESLSFGGPATVVLSGTYNNVTGPKANVSGTTEVMAASTGPRAPPGWRGSTREDRSRAMARSLQSAISL